MIVDSLSDLHLDFYIKNKDPSTNKIQKQVDAFVESILPEKIGDALVIAGDTSHYNNQTKVLLKSLKKIYKYIFLVPGNHDMYAISRTINEKYSYNFWNRLNELKSICEEVGVYYLDGNVVEVDGVKFGGCGGWYDLPTNSDREMWRRVLNDSNLIYEGPPINIPYSYGRPTNNTFDTQVYYEDQLQKLRKVAEEGCDVLINHICQDIPPDYALPPEYRGDPTNMFYYVDNFDLIKQSNCEYYIYGHTHNFQEYLKENINFLCNPKGYPHENNNARVIQIEV